MGPKTVAVLGGRQADRPHTFLPGSSLSYSMQKWGEQGEDWHCKQD